jgi:hypothetical protein
VLNITKYLTVDDSQSSQIGEKFIIWSLKKSWLFVWFSFF